MRQRARAERCHLGVQLGADPADRRLEMPASTSRALTRSSTLRVEVPCTSAFITTGGDPGPSRCWRPAQVAPIPLTRARPRRPPRKLARRRRSTWTRSWDPTCPCLAKMPRPGKDNRQLRVAAAALALSTGLDERHLLLRQRHQPPRPARRQLDDPAGLAGGRPALHPLCGGSITRPLEDVRVGGRNSWCSATYRA